MKYLDPKADLTFKMRCRQCYDFVFLSRNIEASQLALWTSKVCMR